ncbi:MAG TPA: hypothetical protein VNV39_08555 [Stellaceae bacterium]|jgi:hypothetical protein|nr:hypothetical protein [Stellaceae bacterium]HXC28196.1 hypothetical protein [Stellaceae bacterium]
MPKPATWVQTVTGAVAGAGSRVLGLAFGKAIAFTYAVIVSVVANIVFDFVRDPPHPASTDAMMAAAVKSDDGAVARAPLPAPPPRTEPPENPRPGPGSGGLY